MNREQQEMALWRRVFAHWYKRELFEIDTCGNVADAAVAEFRKRYPVEPAELPVRWYTRPPFDFDGARHMCWVRYEMHPRFVYYEYGEWWHCNLMMTGKHPLDDQPICPITKPPEPTS